ncbi:MAG: hypothetical protein WBQ14_09425 [Gaiellaceae bacterium]
MPATKALITRALRQDLHQYSQIEDVLDVVKVLGTEDDEPLRVPSCRADIFGETYWDLAPNSLGSEPLIYFAALFILSDVVRYQGQWRRLLDDHPEEAILIDRFLEIAARKLPNLALNDLSSDLYLFRTVR